MRGAELQHLPQAVHASAQSFTIHQHFWGRSIQVTHFSNAFLASFVPYVSHRVSRLFTNKQRGCGATCQHMFWQTVTIDGWRDGDGLEHLLKSQPRTHPSAIGTVPRT